jgi:hypothetical protein
MKTRLADINRKWGHHVLPPAHLLCLANAACSPHNGRPFKTFDSPGVFSRRNFEVVDRRELCSLEEVLLRRNMGVFN